MATAEETRAASASISADNVVEFVDVGWDGFQSMLRIRGDHRDPRLLYLDGSLTLVSPSMPHEQSSRRLGLLVPEVAAALGVPFHGVGSTTLGRELSRCGVEGDQTFYFANAERIRGKRGLDLNVDPPPDLAIEVVVSHSAKQAMEIYRRLGVPELWICTERRIRFYRLGDDGSYAETPVSIALAPVSSQDVFSLIQQHQLLLEFEWLARLRDWIRDVLLPRARGGGPAGGA